MEMRDPFLNISPLDHRYWMANKDLFNLLSETLSEKAAIKYLIRAEVSLLACHIREHSEEFSNAEELSVLVNKLEDLISPEEVAAEEEITKHNIRALVNVIQRYVPKELAPWVHLGATSADILDTAMAMRIRDALRNAVYHFYLIFLRLL